MNSCKCNHRSPGIALGDAFLFIAGTQSGLPPTKEQVNVFARVCLSVCLSVSKITQKRVHGFG